MKQKKGQFFLVAAVLIVSLLVGIFLSSNIVFSKDSSRGISHIRDEVVFEGGGVIDQGLIEGSSKINDFIGYIVPNLFMRNRNLELVFFLRDNNTITILNLAKEEISVRLNSSINRTVASMNELSEIKDVLEGNSAFLNLSVLGNENKLEIINLSSFEDSPEFVFYLDGDRYLLNRIEKNRFAFLIKQSLEDNVHVETGSL